MILNDQMEENTWIHRRSSDTSSVTHPQPDGSGGYELTAIHEAPQTQQTDVLHFPDDEDKESVSDARGSGVSSSDVANLTRALMCA